MQKKTNTQIPGNIVYLYNDLILPLLNIWISLGYEQNSRQLTTEIKNAQAHIMWAFVKKSNQKTEELKKAYANLPRTHIIPQIKVESTKLKKELAVYKSYCQIESEFWLHLHKRTKDASRFHVQSMTLLIDLITGHKNKYAEYVQSETVQYENQLSLGYAKRLTSILRNNKFSLEPEQRKSLLKELVEITINDNICLRDLKKLNEKLIFEAQKQKKNTAKQPWEDTPLRPLGRKKFGEIIQREFDNKQLNTCFMESLYLFYRKYAPMQETSWDEALREIKLLVANFPSESPGKKEIKILHEKLAIIKEDCFQKFLAEIEENNRRMKKFGEHDFLVIWFADIMDFSQSKNMGEVSNKFYSHFHNSIADTQNTQPCLFANTWGDAGVVVFADLDAALKAAWIFRVKCQLDKIPIRIGLSAGETVIRENPIIGVDVIGATINEAARMEPIARKYEILMPARLSEKIPKKYTIKPLTRQLKKSFGTHKKGEKLSLVSITFQS